MKKQRRQTSDKKPILLAAALLLFCGLWLVVPKISALVAGRPPATKSKRERVVSRVMGPILRGNIYDRRGTPLAISLPLFSIYVKPVELRANRRQVALLAAALKMAPDSLQKHLKSERCVVWLARYISPRVAEEIRRLQIRGLYLVSEPQRFYPQGKTGSHVVGCFKEGHGLTGIEFSLDQVLQGAESGLGLAGPVLASAHPAQKDRHVILQLDTGLQKMLAKRLAGLQRAASAAAVWGVVMQADNGAVLAMASLPTYDPNRFWEFSEGALVNRAAESKLAIDSLAGLFNLAEILDSGKSPKGIGDSGGSSKGEQWHRSPAGDFVSGALWRMLALAPAGFSPNINKFFQAGGAKSAKGVTAEAAQESTPGAGDKVSALQLLSGFASLVNGGRVPTPRLVRAVYGGMGEVRAEKVSPGPAVLKPETSGILRALLRSGGSRLLFCSLQENGSEAQNKESNGTAQRPPSQETIPGQNSHFNAVMLGYLPGRKGDRKGDCVLAMALQDGSNAAAFRLQGWQGAAAAILKKSVRDLAAAPAPLTASSLRVDIAAAYTRWRTIQEKVAQRDLPEVPSKKKVMPKVTGLSLRKALHILQPIKLPFAIKGSGVVIAQYPKPGMLVRSGRINLRLQPDTAAIRSM